MVVFLKNYYLSAPKWWFPENYYQAIPKWRPFGNYSKDRLNGNLSKTTTKQGVNVVLCKNYY